MEIRLGVINIFSTRYKTYVENIFLNPYGFIACFITALITLFNVENVIIQMAYDNHLYVFFFQMRFIS